MRACASPQMPERSLRPRKTASPSCVPRARALTCSEALTSTPTLAAARTTVRRVDRRAFDRALEEYYSADALSDCHERDYRGARDRAGALVPARAAHADVDALPRSCLPGPTTVVVRGAHGPEEPAAASHTRAVRTFVCTRGRAEWAAGGGTTSTSGTVTCSNAVVRTASMCSSAPLLHSALLPPAAPTGAVFFMWYIQIHQCFFL
jgi:hypothetical protein